MMEIRFGNKVFINSISNRIFFLIETSTAARLSINFGREFYVSSLYSSDQGNRTKKVRS